MARARRRAARLSMTSLIDVIFLLLLFFMLSSTFSRFAEVELHAGGTGPPVAATPPERILFLRLGAAELALNGAPVTPEALEARLREATGATLLISVTPDATAQSLTDALVTARRVPDLAVSVLEAS